MEKQPVAWGSDSGRMNVARAACSCDKEDRMGHCRGHPGVAWGLSTREHKQKPTAQEDSGLHARQSLTMGTKGEEWRSWGTEAGGRAVGLMSSALCRQLHYTPSWLLPPCPAAPDLC